MKEPELFARKKTQISLRKRVKTERLPFYNVFYAVLKSTLDYIMKQQLIHTV